MPCPASQAPPVFVYFFLVLSLCLHSITRAQTQFLRPFVVVVVMKGVKGWSAVQQQQKDYRKAREEDALRYAPITQQDLIDTGTRDYESAKRAFGGRAKDATQGLKVIEFMSYVGKDLTTIPLELRDGPRIRTLHMGHNMLPRIDVSFFKMPIIRELNLDQNELEEIPAEFRLVFCLSSAAIWPLHHDCRLLATHH
jgi:hypothetical protein